MLGGAVKFDHFESAADFAVVDSDVPPFVRHTTLRYHVQAFGVDSGEIESETDYSDYRRVTCYNDRFEVNVGIPQMLDVVPESSSSH